MSPAPVIKLIPESYPGSDLTMKLGSLPPTPVENTGIAKYNSTQRPRKRSLMEFAGEEPVQVEFSVLMNEWPNGDVGWAFGRIYGWGARNSLPTMPTVLRTEGPIPFSNLRWILTGISLIEQRQRITDWALCYFELKLTLTEWTDPDLIVQSTASTPEAEKSPAISAQQRFQQQHAEAIASNPKLALAFGVEYKGTSPSGAQTHTYTVKRGDTLSSIAARELGKSSRWPEIRDLNGVRDPNRVNIGQVLRLPNK